MKRKIKCQCGATHTVTVDPKDKIKKCELLKWCPKCEQKLGGKINFRLINSDDKKARELAKSKGITLSKLIRQLVSAAVAPDRPVSG